MKTAKAKPKARPPQKSFKGDPPQFLGEPFDVKAADAAAAASRQGKAKRVEREFFAWLNGELKPLRFKMHDGYLCDPLEKGFEKGVGVLWPLPEWMIAPKWRTQDGRRVRGNPQSFDIVAGDKREFAGEALATAKLWQGDLVPNDGASRNDRAFWEFGFFTGRIGDAAFGAGRAPKNAGVWRRVSRRKGPLGPCAGWNASGGGQG